MGASTIMVIRHAEKPGTYNGQQYKGVNATASSCGDAGKEDLVTLGWERAGGLVTLFAPPWGPKSPLLTPQVLFAANASDDSSDDADDTDDKKKSDPSQRPYETLTAVAAALATSVGPMPIDQSFKKKHYDDMVTAALASSGVVLIAWQHEDIPSIGQSILTQTKTSDITIPGTWDGTRYDLVWIFSRPTGSGAITGFSVFAQMLLAGDGPIPT